MSFDRSGAQGPMQRSVGSRGNSATPRARPAGMAWGRRLVFSLITVATLLTLAGTGSGSAPRSMPAMDMGRAAIAAISLSETRGTVGRTITVSGTGFGGGEIVDIRWKSTTATPLASPRATTSGTFSAQVVIPDAPIGQHAVIVSGRTTAYRTSVTYTVVPSLGRVPAEGAPWTRILVTARGYGANEDVRLNWLTESGTVLGTFRTNGSGTGSTTITMPNGKPGWNDYTGYGLTSRGRAWGSLKILSSVTLSPTAAAPGTAVQATARGFPPGETAQVTWNASSTSAGSSLCRGTIATNGTFVCRFIVPKAGAGVYPVTVRSGGGTTLAANLTVTGPASVSISPASGAVGTNVSMTAGGFAANESVTVSWDSGVSPRTLTASSQGAVSLKATVPRLAIGGHTLRAQGMSSRRVATTPFTVTSTPATGTTSRVSAGVYNVYATREGLVGGTTSSGHKIVANDYFVSLPGCTPTNCPGGPYWGNMTNCGTQCYVKVVNPQTNVCRVEPILDTGPWFRVDDWWNPTSSRYLNTLASNPNTLTQGYTGADAARNGLDVGYGVGPNGIGKDDTGTSAGRVPREVGNRSAIDIADGTWAKLGVTSDGTGGRVTVHMLWQTGADPASQARACGHPLNERPVNEVTNPPGTPNPAFSGSQLAAVGSGGAPAGSGSGYALDGRWSTAWYAGSTPASGYVTVDYGRVFQLTGVRWGLNATGFADQFTVQTSVDRVTWTNVGTFGNAPRYTWHGVPLNRQGRYVRFVFANPNADATIGYLAEIQLWGSSAVTTNPPGTANPSFSGAQLVPVSSSGSTNGSDPGGTHDNIWSSSWYTVTSPASGQFVLDYGEIRQLSGVRWGFNRDGYADQFTVQTSVDRSTWRTVGTFGNAPRYTWHGRVLNEQARYLRVVFANPNADSKVGHMAEIQLWGTTAPAAMAGSNPQFSGAPLPVVASSSSAGTTAPARAHDRNQATSWETTQASPPSQAVLTLDLGRSQPLTGIRWMYQVSGGADRMRLQVSGDGATWSQLVTTSNRAAGTWEGWRTTASARYVRMIFDNPNGDAVLGYVAEVEAWGSSTSFSAARVAAATETAQTDVAPAPAGEAPAATPSGERSAATPAVASDTAVPTATPTPAQIPATPIVSESPADPAPDTTPTGNATIESETDGEDAASPVATETVDVTEVPPPTDPPTPPTEIPPTALTTVEPLPSEIPVTETPPTETPTAEPEPVVTGQGWIAYTEGVGANCRTAPGQDSEVIRLLPEGTPVEILGDATDGWRPVICGDRAGFVFAEFISDAPPDAATEPGETQEPTQSGDEAEQGERNETPEGTEAPQDRIGSSPDDTPTPDPTAEPTPEPTPVPELVERDIVIDSVSDMSVTESDPAAAQSPDALLTLPAGGEDGALGVLVFPVEGIGAGRVVEAQLVVSGAGETGGSGGRLRVIEGARFDESNATWNDVTNAGSWDATEVGWIQPGGETVVDVTGIITADGTITFIIEGTPEQPIAIASIESGAGAYLVITIEEPVAPKPE